MIIYPWPTQIFYGDDKHETYWKKFSKKNNINFISLYDQFQNNNKRKFIIGNFILGDVHWNKNGTIRIFKGLDKKDIFNEISSLE